MKKFKLWTKIFVYLAVLVSCIYLFLTVPQNESGKFNSKPTIDLNISETK